MRRAQQQTITFEARDAVTGTEVLGLDFNAGDIKITKDGGAVADYVGAVVELGFGVYAITLSAAEMDAAFLHIIVRKSGVQPVHLKGFTTGNPSFKVVDDPLNTATTFKTDRAETADDHWAFAGVVVTSGALQGQVREIAGYNGATKFITLAEPLSAEPAAGVYMNLISE